MLSSVGEGFDCLIFILVDDDGHLVLAELEELGSGVGNDDGGSDQDHQEGSADDNGKTFSHF